MPLRSNGGGAFCYGSHAPQVQAAFAKTGARLKSTISVTATSARSESLVMENVDFV